MSGFTYSRLGTVLSGRVVVLRDEKPRVSIFPSFLLSLLPPLAIRKPPLLARYLSAKDGGGEKGRGDHTM